MLEIGQKAPDFKVPNDENKEISLSDFLGQKVVLYFYPRNNTPECAREACSFKHEFLTFQNLNAVILGVSKDSIESHQKFKTKHGLPFMLLSDEKTEICQTYGVWVDKLMYGITYKGVQRSTFLINEKGIITHIWRKAKVTNHEQAVLKAITSV